LSLLHHIIQFNNFNNIFIYLKPTLGAPQGCDRFPSNFQVTDVQKQEFKKIVDKIKQTGDQIAINSVPS